MFYILFDRFNNGVISNHETLWQAVKANKRLQKSLHNAYLPTTILKSPTKLRRGLHLDNREWENLLISEEEWDRYQEIEDFYLQD